MKSLPLEIYTVDEWQENFDDLLSRVEGGETIGITDGENTAVMVPIDDEIASYLRDHDDGC